MQAVAQGRGRCSRIVDEQRRRTQQGVEPLVVDQGADRADEERIRARAAPPLPSLSLELRCLDQERLRRPRSGTTVIASGSTPRSMSSATIVLLSVTTASAQVASSASRADTRRAFSEDAAS